MVIDYFLSFLGVQYDIKCVVSTAQNLRKAEDTFEAVANRYSNNRVLKREVKRIYRTNGNKRIQLKGGREYKVVAPTASAARGDTVDLLVMDELREQHNWDVWSCMVPATLARRNAITWCISNAGEVDSIVLRQLRLAAHKSLGDPDGAASDFEKLGNPPVSIGTDTLGLFEWSAHPNASKTDVKELLLANPSVGYGDITIDSLLALAQTTPDNKFRTECMCQWVTGKIKPPFPHDAWAAGRDNSKTSFIAPDSPLTFGVDVSDDRTFTNIAVVGKRPDKNWAVEIAACAPGIGWVENWFRERAGKPEYGRMRVAVQANGAPVSGLVSTLKSIDCVDVIEVAGRNVGGYCGRLYDAVCACAPESGSDVVPLYHRDFPTLDLAASVATTKSMGDAWAWDRKNSTEDVSALMAASMAYGASVDPDVEVEPHWLESNGPIFFS